MYTNYEKLLDTADGIRNSSKYGFGKYNIRVGQSLVIALSVIDSKLYEMISGSDCDCFYSDSVIDKFLELVKTYLYGEYNEK